LELISDNNCITILPSVTTDITDILQLFKPSKLTTMVFVGSTCHKSVITGHMSITEYSHIFAD